MSTIFQIPHACKFKYPYIFLINSSGFIGVATATQLIDLIGRRVSQIGLVLVAAIFASALCFCIQASATSVLLIMGVKASLQGTFAIMWVTVTELYPTEVSKLVLLVFHIVCVMFGGGIGRVSLGECVVCPLHDTLSCNYLSFVSVLTTIFSFC